METETISLKTKSNPQLGHKEYLVLAIPLIISGISTPLLGTVDTAVVGRIPSPSAIGGVAIGALIFNTLYWLFGFLRVSTTGFTSQAIGANNDQEKVLSFLRPMLIAGLIGLLFILFQQPILVAASYLVGASQEVTALASTYFSIRIWGAPFTLLNYVVVGWLMGMGKVKSTLAIQIMMNLLNITLDIFFVLGLGMGVSGVAYATLIAEVSAVLFGLWIIFKTKELNLSSIELAMLIDTEPLKKMLIVNRDLVLRTICLLAMTGIFTSKGAGMGEVTLAANAILLQIHYLLAYFFGGFANASSILVGKAVGGKDYFLFKRSLKLSAQWGIISAVVLFMSTYMAGDLVVSFYTNIDEVLEMASKYLVWMFIYPFVGFWGLILEGIFSGATEAGYIRNSILMALIVFLLAIWMLIPHYGNTGIWIAFTLFSLGRSSFLYLYVPKLTKLKFC